jgi:putative ABC transport system permease protein
MHDWKRDVEKRLAGLRLEPAREAEIAEELAQHLEDRYEEARSAGATDDEAYRTALNELADSDLLARELRSVERRADDEPVALGAAGRGNPIEDLWRDLRLAVRDLRKRPGFALVTVLTLALGIGANTAIFSFVYAVLLNPLPFDEPDSLVFLAEKRTGRDVMGAAYPNYKDWSERAESFEEMAAFRGQSFTLTGIDEPLQLQGRYVNWNFFQMLGMRPHLGRLFVEDDDRVDAPPTVLLGNGTWRERFGGDPAIVGRVIGIDGKQFTVVGVMPAGYELLRSGDIYVPLGLMLTKESGLLDRGNHYSLYALARLKAGIDVARADREMQVLAAQLEQEHPETNSGNSAGAMTLADRLVGDTRPALLVLLGAVGFVLLIACLNVANLLTVRAAGRQKEIAVRIALGAKRGRIIRQLLTESMVIAVVGGVVGFVVAVWATKGLVALAPQSMPRLEQVGVNPPVLAFTVCVSLAIGLLFGLLPALQATRPDLNTTLKEGGRSSAGRPHERTRRVLLVSEVALALMLLIGAGLMVRTVGHLTQVDPGFDAENLLTARFVLPEAPYPKERRRVFFKECVDRIGALPGVQSAAITLSVPIDGSNWNSVFIVADKPVPARADLPTAAMSPVSADYFDTMKIRLMKGRIFGSGDNESSPPTIVVNETLANRLWPGEDAIGKRLKQGWPEDQASWREVVGVVADVKMNGVDQDTPLQVYIPLAQEPGRSLALLVRTSGEPLAMTSSISAAIHAIDRDVPVFAVSSMDQLMGGAIENQRVTLALLAGFAVLALVLAAVGIYGVMSYAVAQRTHEIGIRSALGARPSHVLRMVIGQGMALALAGVAIGLAGALALTRVMEGLLFNVSATDPATYVVISVLLAAVAVLACYVPARRATKVDPTVALRYE